MEQDNSKKGKPFVICKCLDKGGIPLGIYSTKEKAIKVLDMIQEFIKNSFEWHVLSNRDEWKNYKEDIFQMPVDEDVE